MPTYDQTQARVEVLTFKEGVLSKVAHDLRLAVRRFRIEVEPSVPSVRARLEPSSLEVVCAMKDGVDAPGALSERDRREIVKNLQADVLHVARHQEISFESTEASASLLRGRLTLHGQTRALAVPLREEGGWLAGEVRLDQREFGIKPFSAMLGALRIRPEVLVRLWVPAKAAQPAP